MLNFVKTIVQTPDSHLQLAIFFLQLGTFIAVALYTLFTWKILKQSNRENALSTALHLSEDIKKDYHEIEIFCNDGGGIISGFRGFNREFNLNTNVEQWYGLPDMPIPALNSFKYITTNFKSLIDKLDTLDKESKNILKSFILSFYAERLQPFVNKILAPYDEKQKDIETFKNGVYFSGEKKKFTLTPEDEKQNSIEEESIKIFKHVRSQIKKLE